MASEALSEGALYQQLYVHLRTTDDVSFKLLGIVPLISGTGIVTLFWGQRAVPHSVVLLLALFAASVALALYRWELHNIGVCWWLAKRIGAIEREWAIRACVSGDAASTLRRLRPPSGIDKPQAEALVYGTTILVWLAVPWVHDAPRMRVDAMAGAPGAVLYLTVCAAIGVFALYSVIDSLRTHHWPAKHGSADDQPEIARVNLDLGTAEQQHDTGFLQKHLHERMIFRRASGRIVDKQEYLRDLANTTYDVLDSGDITVLDEHADLCVVTAPVRAKGTSAQGAAFSGCFYNLRVFVKQDGQWQLLAWANTKAGEFGG